MKAVHEHFTLILVTDELSPVRRLQVSRRTLRRAVAGALVAGAVLLVGLVDYVRLRRDVIDVASLREEAQRHGGELSTLGNEVGGIAAELERVRELERKVRVIANLPMAVQEARVPDHAGQGGDDEPPVVESALPASSGASGSQGPDVGRVTKPDGGIEPSALARIQTRARQLESELPARKLSLVDLLEGLEGQSQRLAATPSIWPTDGFVTSGYGNRISPFTGHTQFHEGIDIAADFGTTVVAPARGRVVFVGMDGPFGRKVEIDHGYGIRTHYAHLSKALVQRGETVERGTPIAEVGSTGRSTGPHLHYGVEVNGHTTDPTNYIFE